MFFAKNGIGRVEIAVILLVLLVLGFILYPVYKQNMTYLKPYSFDREKWQQDAQTRFINRMNKISGVCLSNLHQLAMGAEMYAQDHHDCMPGINKINKIGTITYTGWAININKYLKGVTDPNKQSEFFTCPNTCSVIENPISYGYNRFLLKKDGTGISITAINKPDQVGLLTDSSTCTPFAATKESKFYGGDIIGEYLLSAGNFNPEYYTITGLPIIRHLGKINIAYIDGHVASVPSNNFTNSSTHASDNESMHAFLRCSILGLVDNPDALLSRKPRIVFNDKVDAVFNDVTHDISGTNIGGDPATQPILNFACDIVKLKSPSFRYKQHKFKGSLSTGFRPSDYLEGIATGSLPKVDPRRGLSIQIGVDQMVVIVNKNCAIKVPGIELDLTKKVKEQIINPKKFWRLITRRNLQTIINSDGYGMLNSAAKNHLPANYTATRHDWQLYVQSKTDGTRSAIAMTAGDFFFPGGFGAYYRDGGTRDHNSYVPRTPGATRSCDARTYRGIYCKNDTEIIDKVASNPLGIGIVSAAFVDMQKVDILAVNINTHVRWAATFPMYAMNNLSEIQDKRWPFQRKLYAVCGKTGTASEKISTRIFDKGKEAFFAGPLYKSSFWRIPVKESEKNLKPRVGGPPHAPKQQDSAKSP